MIRKLLVLTALALLVAPATAIADSGKGQSASALEAAPGQLLPNPARVCTNLRTSLTRDAFDTTYGTFGKCVSQHVRARFQATIEAVKACKAERDGTSPAASQEGTSSTAHSSKNENDANAFGKCVWLKAKAEWIAHAAAKLNAAKTCWNERQGDVAAFRSNWKTFGACVSAKAKG